MLPENVIIKEAGSTKNEPEDGGEEKFAIEYIELIGDNPLLQAYEKNIEILEIENKKLKSDLKKFEKLNNAIENEREELNELVAKFKEKLETITVNSINVKNII